MADLRRAHESEAQAMLFVWVSREIACIIHNDSAPKCITNVKDVYCIMCVLSSGWSPKYVLRSDLSDGSKNKLFGR